MVREVVRRLPIRSYSCENPPKFNHMIIGRAAIVKASAKLFGQGVKSRLKQPSPEPHDDTKARFPPMKRLRPGQTGLQWRSRVKQRKEKELVGRMMLVLVLSGVCGCAASRAMKDTDIEVPRQVAARPSQQESPGGAEISSSQAGSVDGSLSIPDKIGLYFDHFKRDHFGNPAWKNARFGVKQRLPLSINFSLQRRHK